MLDRFAAVILGGGPAGAICGIGLAEQGIRTLLVEKAVFPRDKVCGCCLNLAAAETLQAVQLGNLPQQLQGVPLDHWEARWGDHRVDAPLPGGWALSRARLDEALLREAAAAGVEIQTGTTATIEALHADRVTVRLRPTTRSTADGPATAAGPDARIEAEVAIVATGLSGGGVERWLPFEQKPSGPFGAGMRLRCPEAQYRPGTIFMACSRDGYAGAVRLEDGSLDIAAALLPAAGSGTAASLAERMGQLLESAGFPSPHSDDDAPPTVRTTPRLRRRRTAGFRRLIAIGDAAGYVEPFTGEGMAWAMSSGLAAAETIKTALGADPERLGRQWCQTRQHLLRRRQWPCRLLAATLQSSWGRRGLFGSLHALPSIATPVIRYMNRATFVEGIVQK